MAGYSSTTLSLYPLSSPPRLPLITFLRRYRQWCATHRQYKRTVLTFICRFYVNTREQPPRSSWEHPLGPIPQGFAPPLGPPPPDRSYSRSPYGGPPQSQGYGGMGYQPSYGQPQGYYNNPQGGYASGPPMGSGNRGVCRGVSRYALI